MGGSQSYISSEAALTALVVAGAIGIGYSQMGATSGASPNTPAVTVAEGQGTASKKGKKKKQSKAGLSAGGDISEALSASKSESQVPSPHHQRVAVSQEVIPGQFDVTPTQTSVQDQSEPSAKPKSKKSKKKAKGKTQAESTPDLKNAQPISSSIDYLSETSAQATPPKVAKRQSSAQQSKKQSPPASSSSQLNRPSQQSTASIETDGSWTRVGPPRRGPKATDADSSQLSAEADPTTSDAGITPSVTGNSSPVADRRASSSTEDETFLLNSNVSSRGSGENRRTLAEKLLPKPRKTGVDDMLETSDFPTLSRVMRVQPLPNEKPASGFSWGDYEDVRVGTDGGENDADGEEEGWGVVTSKRSKRTLPSTSSQSHAQQAPETMTKRQKQNAERNAAKKAQKEESEAARLARLAQYERERERARIVEQLGHKSKGKVPSGGMIASVDAKGKMVWD